MNQLKVDRYIEYSEGASGTQTQAVINGLDADVVALSLESDVNKLVTAGLVASDWKRDVPRQSQPCWLKAAGAWDQSA
jgi:sulfate/thiosulfate transport system substrate-binding protein